MSSNMSISPELLTDTLTAMHWVISPYTDGDTKIRDDYPWIYELALVYNKLVNNLNESPDSIQHDFEAFNIWSRAIRATRADLCMVARSACLARFAFHPKNENAK